MAAETTCKLLSLPTELQVMIMKRIPDLASLQRLVCANPLSAQILTSFYDSILPTVLANSMPHDMQELLCMLFSIYGSGSVSIDQLASTLEIQFDPKEQVFRLSHKVTNPCKTLHRLLRTTVAVHFFTELYPKLYTTHNYGIISTNLNNSQRHHIQRGLLFFEICCALAEAWKPTESTDMVQLGLDTRLPHLKAFLGHLLDGEVEELLGIYEYLSLAVLEYGKPDFQLGDICYDDEEDPARVLGSRVLHRTFFSPFQNLLIHPRAWTYRPWIEVDCLESPHRSRILSQGLVFLRAYSQQPLSAKTKNERRLRGSALGDDFILAALSSLKLEDGPHSLRQKLIRLKRKEQPKYIPDGSVLSLSQQMRFVQRELASVMACTGPALLDKASRRAAPWGYAAWTYPGPLWFLPRYNGWD